MCGRDCHEGSDLRKKGLWKSDTRFFILCLKSGGGKHYCVQVRFLQPGGKT